MTNRAILRQQVNDANMHLKDWQLKSIKSYLSDKKKYFYL